MSNSILFYILFYNVALSAFGESLLIIGTPWFSFPVILKGILYQMAETTCKVHGCKEPKSSVLFRLTQEVEQFMNLWCQQKSV